LIAVDQSNVAGAGVLAFFLDAVVFALFFLAGAEAVFVFFAVGMM